MFTNFPGKTARPFFKELKARDFWGQSKFQQAANRCLPGQPVQDTVGKPARWRIWKNPNPPPIYLNRKDTRKNAKKRIVKIPISEKFWEVQKPFYKKVFGRRRHKLMTNQGEALTFNLTDFRL